MMRKSLFKKNTERGQSFMELGISLVFLLVVLCVMVDLGWAFYTMISLRDIAQEATAYGSMCAKDKVGIEERFRDSTTSPLDADEISSFTLQYCNPLTGACTNSNPKKGDFITVSATYQHQIVTPFVGAFLGNIQEYPLSVTASNSIMALEGTHCDN